MSDQTADALDDAADYIEANGWCQEVLSSPDGKVCAMGAIAGALGRLERQGDGTACWAPGSFCSGTAGRAVLALEEAVRTCWDYGVTVWNDDESRTEQEVLDAFRLAAKQERMA